MKNEVYSALCETLYVCIAANSDTIENTNAINLIIVLPLFPLNAAPNPEDSYYQNPYTTCY